MSDLKELGERKIKVGKKKEKKASRLLELFLPRRSLRRRFSEQFQRDSDLWLQRLRLSRNCCISPANFIRLNVVTIISNYDSSRIFSKRLDSSNCMYGNCTSLMCSVMEEWWRIMSIMHFIDDKFCILSIHRTIIDCNWVCVLKTDSWSPTATFLKRHWLSFLIKFQFPYPTCSRQISSKLCIIEALLIKWFNCFPGELFCRFSVCVIHQSRSINLPITRKIEAENYEMLMCEKLQFYERCWRVERWVEHTN